jgi:hypothetical protein
VTLLLGLANSQNAISVSDRRITAGSVVLEDDANKAATWLLNDARLAVTYSGIAHYKKFITRTWILDLLVEASQPDGLLGPAVQRLCEAATSKFPKLPLSADDQRLSMMIVGFHYRDRPRAVAFHISNWQRASGSMLPGRDRFELDFYREQDEPEGTPALLLVAGNHAALKHSESEKLLQLLREESHPDHLLRAAFDVARATARRDKSAGTIGQQLSGIVIPADPELESRLEYDSAVVKQRIHVPSFVEGRGSEHGVFVIDSPWMQSESVGAVPKVGRNQPCPCGSRKKYKKCHGGPPSKGWGIRFGG